jgi:hypothetical protein
MARTALIAAALLALTASPGQAQTTAPAIPNRVLMQLEEALFPTLRTRPVQNALRPVIAARNARYDACGNAAPCRIESALWTPEELAQAASGASHGDALTRELAGLNGIIHVYGQGQPPASPAIDGPDPKATLSNQDTISAALERVDLLKQQAPAADRGLLLALTLLDGADRLDAIRFGPLARTENAAAFARARRMDWARYRYTALIVPGIGPEDMVTPLSASGKANVDLAAARYRAGLAPFIILSGASVHPRGTRRVEAIEMRQALIERYGIPADALVIDPYARHTTTNLRNASRLLIAMGAPVTRPALIVTHDYQSTYVVTEAFARRNQAQLGYQPMVLEMATVRNEIPARPGQSLQVDPRESLQIDPRDPLDP